MAFADNIKIIIWDWNGTLINDVQLSLDTINQLLKKYNLPQIGLKTYRHIFTFPVRKYYQKLGFDFEKIPFEKVAKEFIELYNERFYQTVELQPYAIEALETFKQMGKKQVLISARELNSLEKDLEHFGVYQYFDEIAGLDDDYADGKEGLTYLYFKANSINPKEVLFIGDTVYDCHIAQGLNAHHFLVANGHNSPDLLLYCTTFVYSNLKTLVDFFLNA